MTRTILIVPPCAGSVVMEERQTPYGTVACGQVGEFLAIYREHGDSRARIYAAKELGADQILAAEPAHPLAPVLEPADLLIPGDVIDMTRLAEPTFFEGKGYGFTKVNPPFCPTLMASLWDRLRSRHPRTFRRALYVGVEGPREGTPAERSMFRQWGGDIEGTGLLPEAFLARELELCYAAIVAVGARTDLPWVLAHAASDRDVGEKAACTCRLTMKTLLDRGVVSADWRHW